MTGMKVIKTNLYEFLKTLMCRFCVGLRKVFKKKKPYISRFSLFLSTQSSKNRHKIVENYCYKPYDERDKTNSPSR
jgi:hypothetical protein